MVSCYKIVLWGFILFQNRRRFPHHLFQRHGDHLEDSTVHVASSPSYYSSSSAQRKIHRCHVNRPFLGRTVERIRSRQNARIYASNRCRKHSLENKNKEKSGLGHRVFLPEPSDALPWTWIKLCVYIGYRDDCNLGNGILHGVLTEA